MTRSSSDIKSRAEVYCNVAFDAMKDASGVDGVVQLRNELVELNQTIARNVEIRAALTSESFDASQKATLVDKLCEGKSDVLISVVKAMLENSDLETLRLSTRLFETKIGEEFSVCIVDVTTAVELDDNLRSLIKDKVKNELGMDAILHETQDKSIVGGIIMSVNGKCIDASMITQLNHARSVLKAS